MKTCNVCNTLKPLSEYYKHRGVCKCCISVQNRKPPRPRNTSFSLPEFSYCRYCNETLSINEFYIRKNARIESICKSCGRKKYIANRDSIREKYHANRETILAKAAAKRIPKPKKPKQSIEDSKRKKAARQRKQRQANPLYKLRSNIGTAIANSFRNRGHKKNSKTSTILGCTFEEFFVYIESQFVEGMSWDNRDRWHIDHIVPIHLADTEEKLLLLNHHSNLRPLWKEDNQQKAGKLTEESLAHPLYAIVKTTHTEP